MSIFLDTSAIIALLDSDENNHLSAQRTWQTWLNDEASVITTSYVLSESFALVQTRFGISAMQSLHATIAPYPFVVWVENELHLEGISSVLVANRRSLSLVDCVSFAVMRRMGITTAFAFDDHYIEQGFTLLS